MSGAPSEQGLKQALAVLERCSAEFEGLRNSISSYGKEDDPEAAELREEVDALIVQIEAVTLWLEMIFQGRPAHQGKQQEV
jgi:hypothetical protein